MKIAGSGCTQAQAMQAVVRPWREQRHLGRKARRAKRKRRANETEANVFFLRAFLTSARQEVRVPVQPARYGPRRLGVCVVPAPPAGLPPLPAQRPHAPAVAPLLDPQE